MKKLLLLTLITLVAFNSMTYAVNRTWNFMKWSNETKANLATDVTNWAAPSATRFSNAVAIAAGTTVMANGVVVAELNGLTFGSLAADKFRIDYGTNPDRLIMNGNNLIINVPDCSVGDTLVVYAKTGSTGVARGVTVANATRISGAALSVDSVVNVFTVTTAGQISIVNNAGLQYRLISISAPGTPAVNPITTGLSTPALHSVPVKTVYLNLNGVVVGHDFASLRKGLYIQKNWYSDGKTLSSKLVKLTD
ncbi:MAG TPA: hypothetical protein VFP20_02850 [Bacteroidales bacterium]|nr:hypothetical protein [Bacteroidales bacterium]